MLCKTSFWVFFCAAGALVGARFVLFLLTSCCTCIRSMNCCSCFAALLYPYAARYMFLFGCWFLCGVCCAVNFFFTEQYSSVFAILICFVCGRSVETLGVGLYVHRLTGRGFVAMTRITTYHPYVWFGFLVVCSFWHLIHLFRV